MSFVCHMGLVTRRTPCPVRMKEITHSSGTFLSTTKLRLSSVLCLKLAAPISRFSSLLCRVSGYTHCVCI